MIRSLYRVLRTLGDLRAVSRGPGAILRRQVRRRAHRGLGRSMRRWRP